jgi:hypothetical protein
LRLPIKIKNFGQRLSHSCRSAKRLLCSEFSAKNNHVVEKIHNGPNHGITPPIALLPGFALVSVLAGETAHAVWLEPRD